MKVRCNSFVLRQTQGSAFSHFDGTWAELEALAQAQLDLVERDSQPGAVAASTLLTLSVSAERFYSGVLPITAESRLVASFAPRKVGEQPVLEVRTHGHKPRALAAHLVLYSHASLGPDATHPDTDFEIVSINARTTTAPEPMTPIAMMRNFLGLPGGGRQTYTAEEFAQAIHYWSSHAMRVEEV